MKVWDLEIDAATLEAIASHAEREYPVEACGLVLGPPGSEQLHRVVPIKNVQDRYHAKDPVQFPRTGRDAFRMDELERMQILDEASELGLDERIVYHSHCDAGAYFSPEDRAMAVQDGIELLPGVVHVVVSIRHGRHVDAAAFRYVKDAGTFEEIRLGAPSSGLPDLTLRSMESREAARPIRPVGGRLGPRRISRAEAEALRGLAEGRQVRVIRDRLLSDLECFAGGLYSPLEGFMRHVDVRSVLDRGRLPRGTAWREPVIFEVPRAQCPDDLARSAIVELIDVSGGLLGLMAVAETAEIGADTLLLGGPVHVVARRTDAAEVRAHLLRQRATRVLAVDDGAAAQRLDLSRFDVVLAAKAAAGSDQLEVLPRERSGWLFAAIAQNLGATHVWCEDLQLRRIVDDTLEIRAWP